MRLPPDARLRADVGSLLEAAGESSRPEVLDPILTHLRLLARWNDAYGLTRITEWPQVLDRHVRESLMPLRWIADAPGRLLDVGSGNGFPVFPILACRPQLAGVLLERSERKELFLDAVVRESGWGRRVVVDRSDAEAYEPLKRAERVQRFGGTTGPMSAADRTGSTSPEDPAVAPSARRGDLRQSTVESGGAAGTSTARSSSDRAASGMSAADRESDGREFEHSRFDTTARFDFAVSRATLAPERFLELAALWVRPGGRVFLFAGELGPAKPTAASKAPRAARGGRTEPRASHVKPGSRVPRVMAPGASTRLDQGTQESVGRGRDSQSTPPSLRSVAHEPISGRRASYLHVFESSK